MRRIRWALAILLCWSVCGASPLDAVQRVERALQSAQRAKPSDRAALLQQAERALSALPPAAQEPLKTLIANEQIADALRTLRAYRATIAPASTARPSEVKAQLDAIFAEPDMQIPPKSLGERLSEAFVNMLDALIRWVQRLFGGLGGGPLTGLTPLIQGVVIVVLVLTLALAASYILGRIHWGRRAPLSPPALEDAFQDARSLTALEWRELARRLASQQQLPLALRAYYLGLLRLLHEARLLEYDPALTNWEHLQRLRLPPLTLLTPSTAPLPDLELRQEAHRLLRPLTLQFDAVWYGGATPPDNALHACETAFESLLKRVQPHAVPA
ncbi:MAG: DUF4129 domain-containing protein [Fimbriimonadales bacterium]